MKKWILILLIVILVLALIAGGVLWYMQWRSLWFSTGRCVVDANGNYLLILDGSPICMGDRSGGKNLFEGLHTGDEIRVLHDGIMETWPGQTGAYYVQKLSDGDIGDIPKDLIRSLSEMGWIPLTRAGKTYEIYAGNVQICETDENGNTVVRLPVFGESQAFVISDTSVVRSRKNIIPGDLVYLTCEREPSAQERTVLELVEYTPVEYSYSYANMYLEIPAGWEYEIVPYSEGCDSFGIHFWPEEYPNGKLRLEYCPRMFGVCGTGLVEEDIRLGGIWAVKGTYDASESWSFIAFRNLPGDYVVLKEGSEGWWTEYGGEAMEILDTVRLAEDLLWESGAINMTRNPEEEYDEERAEFDFESGNWTVRFYRDGELVKTSRIHVKDYDR